MNKKIVCMLVALMVLLGSQPALATTKDEAYNWYYGNASDWAHEELVDAVANGLVSEPSLVEDCGRNITRQEFANLAVNLYVALRKEDPSPAVRSTFTDTTDLSVRIAYNLGIIKGVGAGKFAPNNPVTREQMAVMILNAVNAIHSQGGSFYKGDGILTMSDKANVSSWAVSGVDYVYENNIMKGDGVTFNSKGTTTIEQGVAIVNRVYKKYKNAALVAEKNDYSKGYRILAENDGLYVQYNNTGNKDAIVKYGEEFKTRNNDRIRLYHVSKPTHSLNNRTIYFLDDSGCQLFSYDFKNDSYYNYVSDFGYISDYAYIMTGKYRGYYLLKPSGESEVIAYDNNLNKLEGPVYTLDPDRADVYIDAIYEAEAEAEAAAAAEEAAEEAAEDNMGFYLDGERFDNVKTYGGSWYKGNLIRMTYDNASEGPMALIADEYNSPISYRSSGIYTTTMRFRHEDQCNAGFVFNVQRATIGNDHYKGYYVGLDPQNNNVQVGYCDNGYNCLKSADLGFDVKPGVEYELRVWRIGPQIRVFVDDMSYIDINDSQIVEDGYCGVRGWKVNGVEFTSFNAEKVPF